MNVKTQSKLTNVTFVNHGVQCYASLIAMFTYCFSLTTFLLEQFLISHTPGNAFFFYKIALDPWVFQKSRGPVEYNGDSSTMHNRLLNTYF